MRYENKAAIKAMLLEILAECDQTFSDVLINRVTPIVKQAVKHEFDDKRNELLMEIAVTIGTIMRGERSKPLWESTPEELHLNPKDLNNHMMGK